MVDALVGNDYSLCLCSSLKSAGLDVSLVVTEDRPLAKPVDFAVVRMSPPKSANENKVLKSAKFLAYLVRLSAYIARHRVDVVHYQFFRRMRAESLFYALLRLFGVNLVHTVHDARPLAERRLDYLFNSLIYRASKTLIVHSAHIKRVLEQDFGIDGAKIRIVPHGNFDMYVPEQLKCKSEARAGLGLNADDQVVLFFGFIKRYKGLDMLLRAFDSAAKTNPKLKLLIAGAPDGDELAKHYNDLIASLAARDRVIYHADFIPNEKVADYFIACDLVALPYQNIYHSGVLHLAYSFGRPAIATPVGDFPDSIENGKTGYVLDESTEACLAQTLTQAFAKPENLEAMGEYARWLSETHYSWEHVAAETRSAYSGEKAVAPSPGQPA